MKLAPAATAANNRHAATRVAGSLAFSSNKSAPAVFPAANANAAILFVGWVASKGLPILDTGRESVFHPETKLGKQVKGRTIKVADWDVVAQAERVSKRIVEIWGFPRAEK